MAAESNPDQPSTLPRGSEAMSAQLSRRRLLRAGLGAAPVLMTIASRPVFAGGTECHTPSSHMSINASVHGKTQYCDGGSPGYWKKTHEGSWPPPYETGTLFDTVFGSASGYPNKTLLYVLDLGGGGKEELARHIVAALLNAAKGWTPVLTVAMVIDIWQSWATLGYYEPTAGIHWDSAQITKYLKTTMS